jgi:hypothetical protein
MANYSCYLLDSDGNQVFYNQKPDLAKGDLYISISQILGMLGGNDFLIRWALKEFGGQLDPIGAHSSYMERVSALGTALHKYIEYDLKGLSFPDAELTEEMLAGIQSWYQFKAEHTIELVDSERVLFSRSLQCAGTLDLRVKIDGELYVADLKTGSVQSKAFIQLAAYKHMMKEMGLSDGSEKLLVLGGADSKSKISNGGRVCMHTLESWFKGRVSEKQLFTALLCLRELWRFENLGSRKFEPVIKGMDRYLDPLVQRFHQAFDDSLKEKEVRSKKNKTKREKR